MLSISSLLVFLSLCATGYMEPPRVLTDIVDSPLAPRLSVGPGFENALLRTPEKNPLLQDLAEPELKLAGLRFRPETAAPSRAVVYTGLELMDLETMEIRSISGLPDNLHSLSRAWSPDGSMIAVTNEVSHGVELWLIDVESATAGRILEPELNLVAGTYPVWLSGGDGILATVRCEGAQNSNRSSLPSGPVIQETTGNETPVRTLQDLLQSPEDEDLFQYYLTSELVVITPEGNVRKVSDPCMIWDFDPSPNGDLILLHTIKRPFSYSFNAWDFPMGIQVMDLNGNVVHTVAELPLRDSVPIARGSVHTGPRHVHWRSDADCTLCWVEALDGGDADSSTALRDRVMLQEFPFLVPPVEFAVLENRYGGIDWCNDSLAILREWWWDTRLVSEWIVSPGTPAQRSVEPFLCYSWEDAYQDPGEPLTTRDERGRTVLFSPDGSTFFYTGRGASPEGSIPFLASYSSDGTAVDTLFRSSAPFYERPVMFADSTGETLLFSRESPDDYPNYFLRALTSGAERRVTDFPNPIPEMQGMNKELITYRREDGVELTATLYTPSGYSPDQGPLPMVVWAYPEDYISSDAASRVTVSPWEYDYTGWWSPIIWLTMGYAVLDYPSMPVISLNNSPPNDSFVEQLVMNARAAVNTTVDMGVADSSAVFIGGHSYGAFMAANLLVHTDLFAAGIASTGAYNRTLTPFGFQSEDRSFWEAPEVYLDMSPFIHADRINEPLLIIHGSEDSNPGTFPMQSERLYGAISGLGGTARLVMLPLEGHAYAARESVLHYLWEIHRWLELHR